MSDFDEAQWNRYCDSGAEQGADADMIEVETAFFACENKAADFYNRCHEARGLSSHGFSQEDIWHEMRAIGGDERQAIRSLIEHEARLDD